jgi:Fe-S cluster assembly protein SufD
MSGIIQPPVPFKNLRKTELKKQLAGVTNLRDEDRKEWEHHIDDAFDLPLPGKPDEVWRRFPVERLDPAASGITDISYSLLDSSGKPFPDEDGFSIETGPGSFYACNGRAAFFRDTLRDVLAESRKKNPGAPNDVRENRLTSINRSLSSRYLHLRLEKGKKLSEPLVILVEGDGKADPALLLPKISIHLEDGAGADILLLLKPKENNLMISSRDILLGNNSSLNILTLQGDGSFGRHLLEQRTVLQEKAECRDDFIQSGGYGIADGITVLHGKDSRLRSSGLVLSKEDGALGQKIRVEQNAAGTFSDLLVKSIIREGGKGVFNGILRIPRGARNSVGMERSINLLLGDKARAYALPQLEIVENDVECSHGSSVSSLDPDDLYFLQTRGIRPETGRDLLIQAFIRQVANSMPLFARNTAIRKFINNTLGIPELTYEHQSH